MDKNQLYNDKDTQNTSTQDKNNLDYDYNTKYGDGGIPEIDTPKPSNATNVIPPEVPSIASPDVKDK